MDNQQQDFNTDIKPYPEYPKILVHREGYLINSKTGKRWYTRVNKCGYVYFQYTINNKKYSRKLHKAVAECFVEKPQELKYSTECFNSETVVVKHIDNNKLNNHYSNLTYDTNQNNIKEAHEAGLISVLYGESHGMCKMTEDQVHQVCQIYFVEYKDKKPPSTSKVAKQLGLTFKQVAKIRYRVTWCHITCQY